MGWAGPRGCHSPSSQETLQFLAVPGSPGGAGGEVDAIWGPCRMAPATALALGEAT